jgi:hypothetical protein
LFALRVLETGRPLGYGGVCATARYVSPAVTRYRRRRDVSLIGRAFGELDFKVRGHPDKSGMNP